MEPENHSFVVVLLNRFVVHRSGLTNPGSQIYTFRLLIEYARIIDDNRDRIGYSGDGSELARYDRRHPLESVRIV